MKNDWIAMKIENNPNDLFIERNIKDCFKKDKQRIPRKLMQSKPQRVLKSLEYITEMSKKQS